MTLTPICPDDLLLAARRSELSLQDEVRLNFHIERCGRCRAELDAGRAFDAVLSAQAGDDEIATRVASRIIRPRARQWVPVLAGAGLLFVASIAVAKAGVGEIQRIFGFPSAPAKIEATQNALPVPRSPRADSPRKGASADAGVVEGITPPASPEVELKTGPEPKVTLRSPDKLPPSSPSAAELFAEANALRGSGKSSQAQKRYAELQSRFPGSTEAKVSLVSLGRLELSAAPASALRHFDAYLAQTAHSTLAEEALFGRASALSRLGRTEQERAAWKKLLERYPSSVYAERAKTRIAVTP